MVSSWPLPAARKPSLSRFTGPGCKSLLRHCQSPRDVNYPSTTFGQLTHRPESNLCQPQPHHAAGTGPRRPPTAHDGRTGGHRVGPSKQGQHRLGEDGKRPRERVNERARVGVRVRRERGSWRGLGTRRLVLHRLPEGFRRRRPGILTSTSRRQHRDQTEILYNTTTNQPFQNEENHNA